MITEITYKSIRKIRNKFSVNVHFIMFGYLLLNLIVLFGSASAKSRSGSKIVGGTAVKENAAPYMAALFYFEENVYGCGGAIIHPNFVLTAGHCFEEAEVGDVRILVGTNNLKNGTNFHQVEEVIIHNRYSIPYLPHNDIALARVDKKFEFSPKVQPISFSKNEVPENAVLTLTGFGQTGNDKEVSDILQTIDVERISIEECNLPTDPLVFGEGHLCTFNEFAEQGVCYGDR